MNNFNNVLLLCFLFLLPTKIDCRCSNRNGQKGYFHGYSVRANVENPTMVYCYEDDCLESRYLVTSSETW